MAELALLVGLGAVGYLLAKQEPSNADSVQETFTLAPRPTVTHDDGVVHSEAPKGHANEVPFFGARVTQSMQSGATNHILDNHAGAGKEYFQKREVQSFADLKPGVGNPFGAQDESEFMQSRMVSSMRMNNTFPIDQVQVGPGVNDGYTNIPKGGFQQEAMREQALPKTTDETRVASKPKLTQELQPTPGMAKVAVPGVQAQVNKNKPDRFAVLGMDRVNTAVGAQVAAAIYPEQPMKEQARESTSVYYISPGGGREGFWAPQVRAFTEPFQEFMRLTAEGRPGPAGAQGTSVAMGVDSQSAKNDKDDTRLSEAARFNAPMVSMNASTEALGSYRFNTPLQQDINMERNAPDLLNAHRSNPYTQSLSSI